VIHVILSVSGVYACIQPEVVSDDVGFVIRIDYMTRSDVVILLTYTVISFLRSLARYGAGLIYRRWLRTPASTLPTRFPAALGIGHGPACGLANACALVYVAA